MPKFIVFLGPPGVGKGTQAELVAGKAGIPHISSGDLFRENIKKQTSLGKLAESIINRGDLVPDDVTIGMIRERLSHPDCENGAILDGFPRTTAQADSLDELLADFNGSVQAVPLITAPENVLVERLSGRWTCRKEGHIFHEKFNPPAKTGVCDLDGSPLYQREDDKVETVTRRIQVYALQTAPLVDYYRHRDLLIEIDGSQPIEGVTADLMAVVGKIWTGNKKSA